MNDALVTFIIPTVARETLNRTLHSLQAQTHQNWKAFVGFDGFSVFPEMDLIVDDRIKYYLLEDKLGNSKNGAGLVRNYLMNDATSDWVAFVDDDDTVKPSYVEWLTEEIDRYAPDCVVFRMTWSDQHNNQVLPAPGYYDIVHCSVGISFAVRIDFVRTHAAWFEQHSSEDFSFLEQLKNLGAKIIVSDRIAYNVRF
jgi:glycosyltransferase involved in cell wall biosynthesis